MVYGYQLDTVLDCGDLGHLIATVDGQVTVEGEYTQPEVLKAVIFFERTGVDVTSWLTRTGRVDLEERISDRHQAAAHDPRAGTLAP